MTPIAARAAILAIVALTALPAQAQAPPASEPLRVTTHRLLHLLADADIAPVLPRRPPAACLPKADPFPSRYSPLPEAIRDNHLRVTLTGGGAGRYDFRDALVMPLPRRVTLDLTPPDGARLAMGYRVMRCAGRVDSARLRVTIDDATGTTERVYPLALQPPTTRDADGKPHGSRWRDLDLDLPVASDVPARLTLSFETDPPGADAAILWAEPVITGRPRDDQPGADANVLLIIIDAVRADVLGPASALSTSVTPHMDAVFQAGAGFSRAFAVANQTRASTVALYQSQPPSVGGFHARSFWLSPRTKRDYYAADPPLITRGLAAAGWRATTIGHNHFLWDSLPIGLDHGWDRAIDFRAVPEDTPAITAEARRFIADHAGERWFLAVNYTSPHTPYLPPEGYEARVTEALGEAAPGEVPRSYIGEVAYVDDHVRGVLDALREQGLDDRTLVIVTADHGELMANHHACYSGRFDMPCHFSHGLTLYDEELHVPLGLAWPGRLPAGVTVDALVSHLDVAPTVLDLLELPPAPGHVGRSLAPLLAGLALPPRPVYAEGRLAVSLRDGDVKLIAHARDDDITPYARTNGRSVAMGLPRNELFDVAADPVEKWNLALDADPRVDTLLATLERERERMAGAAATRARIASEATSKASSEAAPGSHAPSTAPAWNVLRLVAPAGDERLVVTIRAPSGALACRGAEGDARCTPTEDGLRLELTGAATAGFESAPWDAPLDVDLTLDGAPVPIDRVRLGPYGLALLRLGEALDSPERLALAAGRRAPHVDPDALGVYLWRSPRVEARAGEAVAAPLAPEAMEGGAGVDEALDGDVKRILQELGYVK